MLNEGDVEKIILVNKEEAEMILDLDNGTPIKSLLRKLHDAGPEFAVITNGQDGAYSYDGQEFIHIPATKTKVTERTGAGDSFSTGYISAIVHGKDHQEALIWGTMNSDSVIKYVGPQEGLLTLSAMKKKIKCCPVKPKKI